MNFHIQKFSRAVKHLAWGLPFLFLVVPLPVAHATIDAEFPLLLCGASLGLSLLAFLFSRLLAEKLPATRICVSLYWLIPALTFLLSLLLCWPNLEPQFPAVLGIAVFVLITTMLFYKLEESISGKGPLSLLLFLNLILSVELGLRSIPETLLIPEVGSDSAKLSRYNRAVEVFDKNGFRGRKPAARRDESSLRIFATGGSSTFGVPLKFSASTYPAVLETILSERHPTENHQVFNAGVAGFGVTQIIDSLERRILAYKPDIVTVCAWFNDAAMGPGWYGFPGKSEAEALRILKTLERLQTLPVVGAILRSRLFLWYRFFLTHAKDSLFSSKESPSEKRRRMEPDEFAQALRQIVELGDRHHFLPVVVFEPEHRSLPREIALSRNRYFQAITKIATELQVPLVDTLTPFAERSNEWLHYDIIHFNEEGHRIIAEAIYQKLFVELGGTARSEAFFAAKGFTPAAPGIRREVVQQWSRKERPSDGKVSVYVRAPYLPAADASDNVISVGVYSGTKRIKTIDSVRHATQAVELNLHDLTDSAPITELAFRADISLPELLSQDRALPPAWIELSSNAHSAPIRSGMVIHGRKIVMQQQGYQFIILSAETGRIVALRYLSAEPSETTAAISDLEQLLSRSLEGNETPLLLATLDGAPPAKLGSQELSRLFRRCGGSGELPQRGDSFLFVGACDRPNIKAVEKRAPGPQLHTIGSPEQALHALLEVTPFNSQGHLRTYYR